ncbi:hypothetical protein GGH91_005864 [Coemansia sp. RSA 2671]|nr:hypothetical protein GGH91_005864 [Coemansia sp. RSA 2671]
MGGRRDLRELPGGQLSDSPVGGAPLSNITNLPSVSFSFDFGDTRNVRFGGSSATEPSQRSSHGSDSGDLNKVSKPANSASTAGSQLLDNASPSPLPVNSSSSSSGGTVVSLIPTVQPGEPAAPTGSLATQSTAPPAFNTEAKAVESSDEPDSDAEGSGQRKTARRKKHRKHKRSKRNQARRRRKEAAALAAAEHISEPDNAPDAASPQNPVASIPEPATTGAVPETPSVLGLDTIAVGNSGSVVEVPNNNDFESLLEFVHNLTDEGLEQVRANMMATGIPIDDELFGVPTETTAPAALAETAETEESGDQPSASGAVQHPTTTSSVQPNW